MIIKKILKYSLFICLFCFIGCLHEEMLEAKAEFQFTEVPIQNGKNLVFANLSKNAETFEWTFDNGVPNTSNQFNPGQVKYTTKGTHQIKLKVSNKDGSVSETIKSVIVN